MLNKNQLTKIGIDEKWLEPLNNAFNKYAVTDANEKAMFLAQTTHESNDYKRLEESFNYKPERLFQVFKKRVGTLENAKKLCSQGAKAIGDFVYGGRLGNNKDEGYKYRGRGIIQLTGKNNYKGQTDLSHNLKRKSCIIPYIPSQKFIDNNSGNKFACCYKKNTPAHLFPQRLSPVGPYSLLCAENQADSSQQKHCPVGKPTEYYFKSIISRSACNKQKQILAEPFHKKPSSPCIFNVLYIVWTVFDHLLVAVYTRSPR